MSGPRDEGDLEGARYPESDERPHLPKDDPKWQESYVVSWYDEGPGIGGFLRIGHEPGLGQASLLCGVVTREGLRFRRTNDAVPLEDDDTADDLFRAGPSYAYRFDGDDLLMKVDEPECSLDLRVSDFYPRYNYWAVTSGGRLSREVGGDHYQVAGRVHGSARVGANSYDVDGLAHRDHSWGVRHWASLLGHRWFAGTLGPDLSFSLITTALADGTLARIGMVARDGEVAPLSDIDIVVYSEADTVSHRGGRASGLTPDGWRFEGEARVVDGIALRTHNLLVIEGIGTITVDGRTGYCDLEASRCVPDGEPDPTAALLAVVEDGLSRRS